MDKQDFINRLRTALSGNVAPNIVTENISYYDEYIDAEIRAGKSEAEILGRLGDPRLIAKTIIDTNPWNGQQEAQYQENEQTYRQAQYVRENSDLRVSRIPGWLMTIITILLMVAVVSVALSVLSFLAPVIITIVVVLFLVKLFRDWLN